MMPKFRKKPVVIEARQWTCRNFPEMVEFAGDKVERMIGTGLWVHTLEGGLAASPNDWIIKGVKGEFYPCKPDIFAATYEAVD